LEFLVTVQQHSTSIKYPDVCVVGLSLSSLPNFEFLIDEHKNNRG
jgi:hypothetical protein